MKKPHLLYFTIEGNTFPAILDTLEESLFLIDSEFQFTWYNNACDQLYRSVSGKPIDNSFDFNELLTAEQQLVFKDHLIKVLGGEKAHFEWNYRKSISKWLSVSLYPFTTNNGKFIGICGSLRDITEKKVNEQILLRNTAVLNSISEGIVLVDADFNILTFNRRAYDMIGKIDGQPRLGENFINLLPRERRIQAIRGLHAAFRGEHIEYEQSYASGFWILINCHPVRNDSGDIKHVSISFRNITERKQSEDRLKASEKKRRQLEEEQLRTQIEQQKEITRATLQGQEAERNALGIELHDNITQLLAAINLQLCYCINNYKIARPVIRESRNNILRAMEEIRALSHKMVIPRFSATSLQEELNGLIANYRLTYDILMETKEWDEKSLPHSIKETFFRIAQEKLNNIHKHAQAKQITIHLKNDALFAFMCIKDNGIGFDPTHKKNGIGIANIINRVEAYNGTCELVTAPGMGCTLFVRIPYDQVK